MKLYRALGVLLASTLLLAGCTTDRKEVRAYEDTIQQASSNEQVINSTGQKLNDLEKQKQQYYKKIVTNNPDTRVKVADKMISNINERSKEFNKEVKAMNASNKEFKKASKHINQIKDDSKRKELKELDDALKDKYKKHDDYAAAYRNILDKERSYFKLLKQKTVMQQQEKENGEAINKAQKTFKQKFEAYIKALNKVNKEKGDIDKISE